MKMYNKYSARFRNGYKFLWPIIIAPVMILGGVLLLSDATTDHELLVDFFAALAISSLWIVPTLYIHIQYYRANRGDTMDVDLHSETIKLLHHAERLNIRFAEIRRLVRYKTPGLVRRKTGWTPWGKYNHARIVLDDAREIVITCFLADEFDLPINDDKKELIQVLYPRIRGRW